MGAPLRPPAPGAKPNGPTQARRILLSIYQGALSAVNGRTAVSRALQEPQLAASLPGCHVVAVGKAAAAMTLGAFDALGEGIAAALVISRDGHFGPAIEAHRQATPVAAGHPVPDERSLHAGERLIEAIRACPPGAKLLFLVSGGASSLVEVLRPGVSLELLRRWNEWALANDLGIADINAVRTRLSAIKGGKLLAYIANEALALFVSDVPGNDPSTIGSGLLGAGREWPLPRTLPDWVEPVLASAESSERTPARAHIERRVVATLEDAIAAAEAAAVAQGLRVRAHPERFSGPAMEMATRACHELMIGSEQLHIWGGESTVVLPARPGRGGRCQHLALAAARLLVSHAGLALLAAGTDGSDGPTVDAGALVDAETIERGTLEGLDADDSLRRADSGTFLEAAGDLVHTGPTGTNVGDLVLALKLA